MSAIVCEDYLCYDEPLVKFLLRYVVERYIFRIVEFLDKMYSLVTSSFLDFLDFISVKKSLAM